MVQYNTILYTNDSITAADRQAPEQRKPRISGQINRNMTGPPYYNTEKEISLFQRTFRHWLNWKLSN